MEFAEAFKKMGIYLEASISPEEMKRGRAKLMDLSYEGLIRNLREECVVEGVS